MTGGGIRALPASPSLQLIGQLSEAGHRNQPDH